jgi:hypothetical protein
MRVHKCFVVSAVLSRGLTAFAVACCVVTVTHIIPDAAPFIASNAGCCSSRTADASAADATVCILTGPFANSSIVPCHPRLLPLRAIQSGCSHVSSVVRLLCRMIGAGARCALLCMIADLHADRIAQIGCALP